MIRDSEYQVIVQQAPLLIWRADTTGACDWFNQRWLAFTGRTLEQEQGDGWAEGVHPEDLGRCVSFYRDHFARREPFEMEYRLRRHDGAWRWVLDRGTPTHAADGTFLGYIGSCIDVSDRVEAQEALARRQQEELNALRGLLPLCSGCKQIRDEQGVWHPLERYLCAHSCADFTHTFCPTCIDRLYPEAADRAPGRQG
jgi:PAS domain S-box-containing protein